MSWPTTHADIVPAQRTCGWRLLTIGLVNRLRAQPVVLVPVKDFTEAKLRLAPVLTGPERTALSERMVLGVLAAAGELGAFVVCDHPSVAQWARSNGATPLLTTASGLNGSLTEAVARIEGDDIGVPAGCTHALIAHGDLPLATTLDGLCHPNVVTMVPDRHDDGTNVLCLPLRAGFEFRYGPGSYAAHVAEAHRCRLGVLTRRVAELALDVDHPDDLDAASHLLSGITRQ